MLGVGGGASSPSPGAARLHAALSEFVESSSLRQDLVDLALVRHRLDLLMSGLAARFVDSGGWDQESYTTPIQWLREEAKLPTGVACQQVEVGFQRESLGASVAALEAGEIGFGHLALIAETSSFYGERGQFDEAAFLELAREQNVSQFRKSCLHARHAQDPEGFVEDERRRHEDRFFKISQQDDGAVTLSGWLDPEGGSKLRSALEPLARRCGVGDERSREQRLADALVEATTANQETEIVVTCTLESLARFADTPAAETEWGAVLSADSAQRLACGGASLRRLLLADDGVVIDFGRRRRLISAPARRAVEARDRHCVWPGCDRPPRWCEAHHQQEWQSGGGTSVGGSVLLCGRHHRLRHERGWRLFKTESGRWRAIPPIPTLLSG